EVKTLLFDRETGLVTALMRFAPGAVLPDHEHVKIEQTYVLEGKLVDKEGPAAGLEVKPGEFVWRESGSRHVAWTPEGGLMLAMFQIPNKFHERDGRVTDVSGQDWETVWGHALKQEAASPRLPLAHPISAPARNRAYKARTSGDPDVRAPAVLEALAPRPRGGTVDTADLKSASGKPECRFESGRGHHVHFRTLFSQ